MVRKTSSSSESPSSQSQVLLQKLRDLRDAVPGYTPENAGGRKHVLGIKASLPNEFLVAASVAIDSSNALKAATQVDTDAVREAVEFTQAFETVADEAEAFARGVRHTIALKRAAAANDALQAYDIAKGLARKPEGASLASHIGDMRRTLGRTGRKKKAANGVPQPPTTSRE